MTQPVCCALLHDVVERVSELAHERIVNQFVVKSLFFKVQLQHYHNLFQCFSRKFFLVLPSDLIHETAERILEIYQMQTVRLFDVGPANLQRATRLSTPSVPPLSIECDSPQHFFSVFCANVFVPRSFSVSSSVGFLKRKLSSKHDSGTSGPNVANLSL